MPQITSMLKIKLPEVIYGLRAHEPLPVGNRRCNRFAKMGGVLNNSISSKYAGCYYYQQAYPYEKDATCHIKSTFNGGYATKVTLS